MSALASDRYTIAPCVFGRECLHRDGVLVATTHVDAGIWAKWGTSDLYIDALSPDPHAGLFAATDRAFAVRKGLTERRLAYLHSLPGSFRDHQLAWSRSVADMVGYDEQAIRAALRAVLAECLTLAQANLDALEAMP